METLVLSPDSNHGETRLHRHPFLEGVSSCPESAESEDWPVPLGVALLPTYRPSRHRLAGPWWAPLPGLQTDEEGPERGCRGGARRTQLQNGLMVPWKLMGDRRPKASGLVLVS